MIAVLLPAYNEEKSLPPLLPKIAEALEGFGQPYQVIVCNDGSDDRTAELLVELSARYPLHVLTHTMNRGLGETVRDLFEYAAAACGPDDVIVRMDCDDTHDPQFIRSMVAAVGEGHDVVIASRFRPGGGQHGVSASRAFISRGANLYMKLVFPIKGVWEYSCGYRAYRAGIIQQAIEVYGNNFVQLKGLGFTCTLEKLIKLHLLDARFHEVPFQLRYDQKQSDSKMVGSVTMLGYLVMGILYHWPWRGWRIAARRRQFIRAEKY